MQTVVMSFGRNQYLGKPDLPINHVHVYFPVVLGRPTVATPDSTAFLVLVFGVRRRSMF